MGGFLDSMWVVLFSRIVDHQNQHQWGDYLETLVVCYWVKVFIEGHVNQDLPLKELGRTHQWIRLDKLRLDKDRQGFIY